MPILIVASAEAGAGRSTIAAAIAYRMARDRGPVTLARLAGDAAAAADAATFASLEAVVAPDAPIKQEDVASLTGDVVLEAPPGDVAALTRALDARVIVVSSGDGASLELPNELPRPAIVRTAVPPDQSAEVSGDSVLAVLPEDSVLAAPSVRDIATALDAKWLAGEGAHSAIGRVMIGTIASDAATPYFAGREGLCVITRFDKTELQLAAFQADLACLVLTGGGEPSPYLLDRVRGYGEDVPVLLTALDTIEGVRSIEGLFGHSRFDGAAKMHRAAELLDEAGVAVDLIAFGAGVSA